MAWMSGLPQVGAVVGHAHGEAAVVAAQGAVRLVEDLVRAAVRAVAFQPQSTQCSTGA